ncbi:hypothetical protein EVAR_8378_1 [Eumeta japonica]|uniref:Uncharacterized protein n=1 Tax=Eumeta variegata TaxID=151549 RepID=A0A4C1VD28_EUMVA|nr:hypothetical protein EVAR_8378_1 [Eumeta japonica]
MRTAARARRGSAAGKNAGGRRARCHRAAAFRAPPPGTDERRPTHTPRPGRPNRDFRWKLFVLPVHAFAPTHGLGARAVAVHSLKVKYCFQYRSKIGTRPVNRFHVDRIHYPVCSLRPGAVSRSRLARGLSLSSRLRNRDYLCFEINSVRLSKRVCRPRPARGGGGGAGGTHTRGESVFNQITRIVNRAPEIGSNVDTLD